MSRRFSRPHLWLIKSIGVIVPRRLRADWRQEWEAELSYRERLLAEWDRLDWRNKLELLRRSLAAFWDALWLQPQRWEDEMIQDLRYGIRTFLKNPGFTAIAVITLALGIGANTAIFSVVNAVLLRPLPFRDPAKLMMVRVFDVRNNNQSSASYPNFVDWRAESRSYERLAVFRTRNFALTGGGEPARVIGAVVSADLFALLGVMPSLGRDFRPEEDRAGAGVVILSHGLWQRRFNADPRALGRNITLNNQIFSVIGVAPAGFQFPIGADPVDLWTTIGLDMATPDGSPGMAAQRGLGYLRVIGRLKPQVTVAQAQAEMDAIARRLEKRYPDDNAHQGIRLIPAHEHLVGDVRRPLLTLFGAVGCVLLIACANVANLLLARATVRHREIAIRAALGASRGRVVRQLLTESVLLALAGGVCGALLALWGTDLLVALSPKDIPRLHEIGADGRALGFTLLISLLTGVVFGVAPALQASKMELTKALKENGRGGDGARRNRFRAALVIAEVAVALVLMVGAGLLTGSFWRLTQVNPGFDPRNALTLRLNLPDNKYPMPQRVEFFQRLQSRLEKLPGVSAASATWFLPLSGTNPSLGLDIEGRAAAPGERHEIDSHFIMPNCFRALGIRLVKGRDFTALDDARGRPVVIINEAFQRRFFPNEDPLGKRIRPRVSTEPGDPEMREIIGVVGDVRHRGLAAEAQPVIYLSYAQLPISGSMTFALRAESDPLGLINAARAEVRALDKELPVYEVETLDHYFAAAVAPSRFNAVLLTIFGGAALLLTAIGLYGLTSYAVTQRSHEIGLRIALGAQIRDVLTLVVTQGMKPALAGVIIGLSAAFGLTRLMKGLLFGVSAADPLTFIMTALALMSVALLACYIPARRALKVDPMMALRRE